MPHMQVASECSDLSAHSQGLSQVERLLDWYFRQFDSIFDKLQVWERMGVGKVEVEGMKEGVFGCI